MLQALAIRDVVIIEQLDLAFGPSLGVLTGETGAGKSILHDALGLACGGRGDRSLVRAGAARAQVSAVFAVPDGHRARSLLDAAGLDADDLLVLRRALRADGKSRAFINDQPVTTTLLKAVGATLLEVHGQHDQQGLADRSTQRDLLDAYGDHGALLSEVAQRHATVAVTEGERDNLRTQVEATAREEAYLRHRLAELEDLAPELGEEEVLAQHRATLLARGKLSSGLDEALAAIGGPGGAVDQVVRGERGLERLGPQAGDRFRAALDALERARLELVEGAAALTEARAELEADGDVEAIETRLFALKDAARKHRTDGDGLVALLEDTRRLLAALEHATEASDQAEQRYAEAATARRAAVEALSRARDAAAKQLEAAVQKELAPLRLERVRFVVAVEAAPEDDWAAHGGDRVTFLVATNPGHAPGPLNRIASGGELSRIMLAIRVVLARLGTVSTLVFDEIDAGVGGAVADAVGERLQRLGAERQVLVVTHAPQVAARANHHLHVSKADQDARVTVAVAELAGHARAEEIARMLAGAKVTEAARAAAVSLLDADVRS